MRRELEQLPLAHLQTSHRLAVPLVRRELVRPGPELTLVWCHQINLQLVMPEQLVQELELRPGLHQKCLSRVRQVRRGPRGPRQVRQVRELPGHQMGHHWSESLGPGRPGLEPQPGLEHQTGRRSEPPVQEQPGLVLPAPQEQVPQERVRQMDHPLPVPVPVPVPVPERESLVEFERSELELPELGPRASEFRQTGRPLGVRQVVPPEPVRQGRGPGLARLELPERVLRALEQELVRLV